MKPRDKAGDDVVLFVPVRACCGQQHLGARCPDDLVMCCICFKRFADDELAVYADDPTKRWDVCLGCDETDRRQER